MPFVTVTKKLAMDPAVLESDRCARRLTNKAQRSSLIWQLRCFNSLVPKAISVQHSPHCGFDELVFDCGSRHHFHEGGVVEWE
jgi:hypothetical protein